MKKHFYLLPAFLLIFFVSQAQFKTGQILLGGNIGFSTQKTYPSDIYAPSFQEKQTNISLNPVFGIAVRDNLVKGFDLTYSSSTNIQNSVSGTLQDFKTSNHSYGVGFYTRLYKSLGNGFYVFMQGRLGGAYNTQKVNYGSNVSGPVNETKGYEVTAGFYPGVSYAISKRVQLETGFQNLVYADYSHGKETFQDQPGASISTYKTNSFSLGTSLSNSLAGFTVGFRVLLGS